MPRVKLTKSVIDTLPTPSKDLVYWDTGSPGFGIKITPKGRKVFIVLYRTGGAGSRLRKYTIGPYGQVTLHQAKPDFNTFPIRQLLRSAQRIDLT
jgi:Arm DNA-binding domain